VSVLKSFAVRSFAMEPFYVKAQVTYKHKTKMKGELAFKKGDVIKVCKTNEDDMKYYGVLSSKSSAPNREGWFPYFYVKKMEISAALPPALGSTNTNNNTNNNSSIGTAINNSIATTTSNAPQIVASHSTSAAASNIESLSTSSIVTSGTSASSLDSARKVCNVPPQHAIQARTHTHTHTPLVATVWCALFSASRQC
jgi:hypothetical protein